MRIDMARCLSFAFMGIVVGGCEGWIVSPAESNQNLADFEVAWAWVDSVYPVFDVKKVNWGSVYAEYRPKAEAALGDEFYQVLHDMLSVLKDPHLYYKTNGGARFFPHVSPRLIADRNTFSPQLVRTYFEGELLVAGRDGVEYGILNGNVGYIRITHFNKDHMMDDFPSVMAFVAGTDGLILDVRNNTGGDHDKVGAVVSMFIESQMAWPLAFYADKVLFESWPPIQPDVNDYRYVNPVVVLMNGASLSSGELFPEVMGQLPNVTLVGDTTAGAGCNDRGDFRGDRRLPSGKMIHIPTGCITRYDGVPWELVGIVPDIRVPQTEGDVEDGRDRQLEYALGLLG
jgi:C-terminal processing protease CtpA/Prc